MASTETDGVGSLEAMAAAKADVTRPDVVGHEDGATPDQPQPSPARRGLTSLALLALIASAVLGGNLFGFRERLLGSATPEPRPPAVSRDADGVAVPSATTIEPLQTVLRSQPWWQRMATLEGVGDRGPTPITIDDGAIQWRVRWSCEVGQLRVGSAASKPLVDAACPGEGEGYGIDTGPAGLAVDADGPWRLEIEQQLDVPLVEAPTPAMGDPSTEVAATGSFYRMDQSGTGTVTIFRLADGSHALRLDDFFVTPNVDLEIHLSPLEAPRTTADFLSAPSAEVAPLDVTAGSMNFVVPPEVDPAQYRSVVIWCPLIDSAYAAATLAPAP